MKIPKQILPAIVFSQFAGTSLWFAGNAILPQIQTAWALPESSVAHVTSMVMFGFIVGTFAFAFLSIADRFKSTKVFLICSILGALFNSSIILLPESFLALLIARFLTGITLAGIYPVGMKIASDWYKGKLGKALGYLVGALVIGSAFPHLLNHFGGDLSWKFVLIGTSIIALLGGLAMYFLVGEGPFRTQGAQFDPRKMFDVFKKKAFRSAAFGYFGHMWELYTLWAFLPFVLTYYNANHDSEIPVSLWTFIIMAAGAIGCIVGGYVSEKKGSAKVAFFYLGITGILCLASPIFFDLPPELFLTILFIWGIAVIGDSPQFSSLNALTAPIEYRGTAITIAVSIGFLLTIPSIQLLGYLSELMNTQWLLFTLVIGPIFGLISTRPLLKRN